MMINRTNKKYDREAIVLKKARRLEGRLREKLKAKPGNWVSWKKQWTKLTVITSLSLASFCMPAMASLVPPIELPNLDWVIKQPQKSTEKAVEVVERSTDRLGSPVALLSLDKKQSLIAQLSQEILADSKEYINHPKVIFLSSLTSDKQSIEYLNTIVSQLEKTGASQVSDSPLKSVLKKVSRKQVIVSMRIDNQGKLLESSIQKSSGMIAIDEAALKIIELAAPYQPLPESMSERYDQVNIVRTFFFDGGE